MLRFEQLRHRYGERTVLDVGDLRIEDGAQMLLLGPSGSGKSSLLHIAAGLLRPTEGRVWLDDMELTGMHGAALDRVRGRRVGIVFQRLHLIPSLSVLDNVLVAQYSAGNKVDAGVAMETLDRLGMSAKAKAKPSSLSLGEAQRVAIARTVVNRPRLILADEPTSSLDDANAEQVLRLLCEQAQGATLLIATHDARAKAVIPQQVILKAAAQQVVA
ncbi:MAG: lolD [Hydrocarboniphaga sp.]|uniref:ABC transporter ATP-binding protein n=1 Tax=Hydrocarboniphaga sp. TaxID=2033016 RepID=UPI002626A7E1|nr:ATP-binding cassette domain-containing protein [Hydrocarboniphaga sp.]MDB5971788.1 lolD [Hydrocarboniphaga sp.]